MRVRKCGKKVAKVAKIKLTREACAVVVLDGRHRAEREIEILVQVRHQFISQIANRSSVISAYVYLACEHTKLRE
jgi:hypothetical protein